MEGKRRCQWERWRRSVGAGWRDGGEEEERKSEGQWK